MDLCACIQWLVLACGGCWFMAVGASGQLLCLCNASVMLKEWPASLNLYVVLRQYGQLCRHGLAWKMTEHWAGWRRRVTWAFPTETHMWWKVSTWSVPPQNQLVLSGSVWVFASHVGVLCVIKTLACVCSYVCGICVCVCVWTEQSFQPSGSTSPPPLHMLLYIAHRPFLSCPFPASKTHL